MPGSGTKSDRRMLQSHNKTIFDILGRHPIHPFPARMAPGIALEALGDVQAPQRVLDPMVGSGTVLAVARARGHRAFGFDVDPLSVLMARVWTRSVAAADVVDTAAEVLNRARAQFTRRSWGEAYPIRSDVPTRAFVRYWFDIYARRQLASLAASIVRVNNDATRDALWCAFSRLIIAKSAGASLAMDLSHSRPHKQFDRAPVKPFHRFMASVEAVVSNCPQSSSGGLGPPATVRHGDARRLDIDSASIDVVLTSPPYLNGIDYLRCSKFSLVWMGYSVDELRAVRGDSIGAEACLGAALEAPWVKAVIKQIRLKPALTARANALLSRYVWDMGGALSETSRVLRSGGRAVYVIGDSMSRGTLIPNSSILTILAEKEGLSLMSRHSRALPANRRYLPPPNYGSPPAALSGRLRREVVLVFAKA